MEVTSAQTDARPGERSRSLAEVGVAIGLAAAFAAVVAAAAKYPFDSAAYPAAVACVVGILSCWVAVRELLNRRRGSATTGALVNHAGRAVIGFAALVAYLAGVSTIGFIVPSLAVCILLPAAVGFRRWQLLIGVAAVCVTSIVLIFAYVLERPLPADIVVLPFGLTK